MRKSQIYKYKNGFGLVDSVLSLSLLAGIITYGIYFSSLRLGTIYYSNLIRSINKEIERDIERLKVEFWSLNYDKETKIYNIDNNQCKDFTLEIINLPSWTLDESSEDILVQSWKPGKERSKVFTGEAVEISRILNMSSPINDQNLNLSTATLDYRVKWGENNRHWLSIILAPEAHGWCE